MRREATTEEWRKLYELAVQFKKMKPWEDYWSADVMAVELPEGTAYFSIMGRLGDCIGLSLYQDDRGYNDFVGVSRSEELGIESEYIMLEQNCITMYIGDREEVPKEQYKVIRQLDLRFRGRGNWIYFETYEKGFFPYMPDQGEVQVYIKYLEKLLDSLKYCEKYGCSADFDSGEIFMYSCKNGEWVGEAMNPPSEGYVYEGLLIQDDIMIAKLKKAVRKKKTSVILETDMFYLRNGVTDDRFDKPYIPKLAVLADHNSGMILNQQLLSPDDDDLSCLTQLLSAWIMEYGAPKKVLVRNHTVQVLVEDLCERCQIELVSDELDAIDDCRSGLLGHMSGNMEGEDMFDISPEDQQMMAELFEEAGMDLDEMREMAMSMTEEEFNAEMMSRLMGFVDQMGEWDPEED